MRSAAEHGRVLAERAAHGAAVLLLAWALVSSLERPEASPGTVTAAVDSAQLAAWSEGEPPSRIHARLEAMPSPVERDWLAALARSGSELSWSGEALVPVAATVEPIASPSGSQRVRVAAPGRAAVTVRDAAGTLDSTRAAAGGLVLTSRTLVGAIEGRTGTSAATAAVRERALLRPVLVVGRAAWESKFVIRALEEEGWSVVARIAVAPGAYVEQGSIGAIDTSRYAAVVVIDASAAEGGAGAAITRYARSGGGVVLAGGAAAAAPFRAIAPGASGPYLPAGSAAVPDSAPRRALSLHPVVLRSPDAVALERRGERFAVAARRVELGRVMQVGYDDTWRWRMGGGVDAPRAHAEWWSSVVSAVAYAPRAPLAEGVIDAGTRSPRPAMSPPSDAALDAAPYAQLIDGLGAPSGEPAIVATERAGRRWWILPAIATLLLLSWGSRRLRGAP